MDESKSIGAPGSANSASPDPEKGLPYEPVIVSSSSITAPASSPLPKINLPRTVQNWNEKIESLAGLEARGITRVLPNERHASSLLTDFQMAFLWFSANLTANNLAVGFLGPLLFQLGFVDSALCSVFGAFLGCLMTAYMSTWGSQSGNRTMVGDYDSVPYQCYSRGETANCVKVVARYFMGYWPSKICVLLNIVIMVGYGMIDCVIGGQILSAVSGGSMSIVVGIIIVALISWIVAVFGMGFFHAYERLAPSSSFVYSDYLLNGRKQMGMGSPTSCSLHSSWLCWSPF